MAVKTDDLNEHLRAIVRAQGAACITVKDGHVLMLSRAKLQQLLETSEGRDNVLIFVNRTPADN